MAHKNMAHKNMNILVVGGGGREHAIIKKLKESPLVKNIFAAPGNGGIASIAECFDVKATDIHAMVQLARAKAIDFCVVAPDDPLVLGMVDAMTKAGIPCFGPDKAAAALEGSKVFSKNLMKKYKIPTAKYRVFRKPETAIKYVEKHNSYPTVIKADGLALGKGVIIAKDFEEARDGINSIMEDKVFGASGNSIVIEEFITGPEVSILSFCDGRTIVPMVSAMDHKRALDFDKGLNTGGMGAIAPNPFYTSELIDICMKTIFIPTVEAMKKEGRPFKGCIFFGLMLCKDGPKVIEYNCRFGDPEAQVVLPLLKTDLLKIMLACHNGTLANIAIKFEKKNSVCVMLASGGYPKKYETGKKIYGLDDNGQLASPGDSDDGAAAAVTVYHSGTKKDNGDFLTAGGRVLGVSCKGNTLQDTILSAYSAVEKIEFEQAHYRKDIGKAALDKVRY